MHVNLHLRLKLPWKYITTTHWLGLWFVADWGWDFHDILSLCSPEKLIFPLCQDNITFTWKTNIEQSVSMRSTFTTLGIFQTCFSQAGDHIAFSPTHPDIDANTSIHHLLFFSCLPVLHSMSQAERSFLGMLSEERLHDQQTQKPWPTRTNSHLGDFASNNVSGLQHRRLVNVVGKENRCELHLYYWWSLPKVNHGKAIQYVKLLN